jgi:hypothetical protein
MDAAVPEIRNFPATRNNIFQGELLLNTFFPGPSRQPDEKRRKATDETGGFGVHQIAE